MPRGYKVKNWKFLTEEFGILNDNHNYNISEKSIKTRPLSFMFWAVSYIIDNLHPKMVFEDVAFLLMFSDMKYFEMHVVPKRTGWSVEKSNRVVKKLMGSGFIDREKPTTKQSLYGSLVYKLEYKYYPTTKYTKLISKLEEEMERVFELRDVSVGDAEDTPNEVKGSPKY